MKVLVVNEGSGNSAALHEMINVALPGCLLESTSASGILDAVNAFDPDVIVVLVHGDAPVELAAVRQLRACGASVPVAVVVQPEAAQVVREAMQAGVQEVLFSSEVSPAVLASTLDGLTERRTLSKRIASGTNRGQAGGGLLGGSAAMQEVRLKVSQVASSLAPVLILGETGVGKGLVAAAIHDAGPRRHLPFRAINCAATPATLIESELFGHERGAFTGAIRRHRGKFEVVGGGTLLLDEVAELPIDLQSKLLRATEERFFQPVGAESELTFAGRLLVSTNANLGALMRDGRFRTDLFYRLEVLVIRVPTLAERAGDIPELLRAFASCAERPIDLAEDALEWLATCQWPGNVRQLRNAVDRLSVYCPHRIVDVETAKTIMRSSALEDVDEVGYVARILAPLPGSLSDKLDTLEKALVEQALKDARGNRSAAAKLLGVHRRVLDRVAPTTSRLPRARDKSE